MTTIITFTNNIQPYLLVILNAFFTGIGISVGLYIGNKHIIERSQKIIKKIKKRLKKR